MYTVNPIIVESDGTVAIMPYSRKDTLIGDRIWAIIIDDQLLAGF